MYMNDLKAFNLVPSEGDNKPKKPRKPSKEDKFTNKIKAILDSPNRKGKKISRQDSNHLYVNNLKGLSASKEPK